MANDIEAFKENMKKFFDGLGVPKHFSHAGILDESINPRDQWQKTVIQQMDIRFQRRYGFKIVK